MEEKLTEEQWNNILITHKSIFLKREEFDKLQENEDVQYFLMFLFLYAYDTKKDILYVLDNWDKTVLTEDKAAPYLIVDENE